jgi:hypothetical protein
LVILYKRSIKTYSSYIKITSISESAVSKRAISCEVAALPTFAYRIERGFIGEGLVLIYKRGKSV